MSSIIVRFAQWTPNKFSKKDQQIHRGEDQAKSCDDCIPGSKYSWITSLSVMLSNERSSQAEEFSDESIQSWKPNTGQSEQDHERSPHWHSLCKTTNNIRVLRVVTLIEHSDAQKERASRKSVVDHIEDCTFCANWIECEKSEHAKSKMSNR